MRVINSKKIIFLILLLFAINGCNFLPGGSTSSQPLTGTEGIVLDVVQSEQTDRIISDFNFEVEVPIIVEVRNLGAYPVREETNLERWKETDIVYISGYNPDLFPRWIVDNQEKNLPIALLTNKELNGVSYFNQEGGFDSIVFEGILDASRLKNDRFKPSFLISACYQYITKLDQLICIDPDPFALGKDNEICVPTDINLNSQAAPIAITKIQQEPVRDQVQLRISIKNVNPGELIKLDSLNKCNPQSGNSLDRDDFDFVKIRSVKVSDESITQSCISSGDGFVRLYDNAGFFTCKFQNREDVTGSYKTNLAIELEYGYKTSISKAVEIIKVPTP